MGSLADEIESYIKKALEQNKDGIVELQRNDLAIKFNCAPSQINYVLSTRFTVERGYLVESRRGGGGFVRIVKLSINEEADLYRLINENIGQMASQAVGEGLIARLVEEGFLTEREGLLMKAVIHRDVIQLELPHRDLIRASILRAMLLTLLRDEFQN
ncbi:CtsR family transcriptional regulator [Zhaonella formicivorans]|uniref:CtsR family transcriptional regulator n=1 Tax=Zhaonella formicivorans TaxID=2528593 RepID=UPI0010DBE52A|nr:CtsR family transcriptional regulator [Zhaonella formicivorans]